MDFIKKVQTDNGKEFEKCFREYLEKEKIDHFFTYPKHPQSNSVVGRFNRTLNDHFLYYQKEDLDDVKLSNSNLI